MEDNIATVAYQRGGDHVQKADLNLKLDEALKLTATELGIFGIPRHRGLGPSLIGTRQAEHKTFSFALASALGEALPVGHPQLRLWGSVAAPAVLRLTSRVRPPAWGIRFFKVVWATKPLGCGLYDLNAQKLLSGRELGAPSFGDSKA